MKRFFCMLLCICMLLGVVACANTTQTADPTVAPTDPTTVTTEPTAAPTDAPTDPVDPTQAPTDPSDVVTEPTAEATVAPTESTVAPTQAPTVTPTATPTVAPTKAPTAAPTAAPTKAPTAAPTVAPTKAPTVAPTAAPTVAPTAAPTQPVQNEYKNLLSNFADGVDTKDKYTAWGWDPENKYIEASHSLECNWGTGGYGKVFLVDGVKTEKVELLFTQGVWVSCTILPGWGEFSGDLDMNTVTWKKGDLNEWLIFDLQTTCVVDKVNFSTLYQNGSHGMPADFTIQVSNDKTNWKTVVEAFGYEQDITSEDQVFTFNAEECRYVRLNFTKGSTKIDNNLAYCAALSEVEIWGRVK